MSSGSQSHSPPEASLTDIAMDRRAFLGMAGMLLLSACSAPEQQPQEEEGTPAVQEPPTTSSSQAETPTEPTEKYPAHHTITATVFWIGEPADGSNGNITNTELAWDSDPMERFGGIDGPTVPNQAILGVSDISRDEHGVATSPPPRHNPFYFALPANEFSEDGPVPGAREKSPWANEAASVGQSSLFKGRWAAITNQAGTTVYAQWIDTGPTEEFDYGYVFGDGSRPPANTPAPAQGNLGAGIDLSPAAAINLGFSDGALTISWRFVDAADVPDGAWKQYPPIDNKIHWE